MASSSSLPLLGQLAIVTGASRGIGYGIALELARQGASVAIGYTSASSSASVTALQKEIAQLPHAPKTYAVQADLSTVEGPAALVASLVSQAGKDLTVDILVNNAGVGPKSALQDLTVDDFNSVYNINVRAPLLLMQAVLPYIKRAAKTTTGPPEENTGGRVINMSSVAARTGFQKYSLYCSSKTALEGMTRCWAAELGEDGIAVNAVCPGPVPSDLFNTIPKEFVDMQKAMTPMQNRIGSVAEIACLVAWLASPASGWVTGQAISATGGFAMY